jgi:hypothetical protein
VELLVVEVELGRRLIRRARVAESPVAALAREEGSPADGHEPSNRGHAEAAVVVLLEISPRWPQGMPGTIIREIEEVFTRFF